MRDDKKEFLYNLKPGDLFMFRKMILEKTDQSDFFVKSYLGGYFPFDHILVKEVFEPTKECFYLPSNLQVTIIPL